MDYWNSRPLQVPSFSFPPLLNLQNYLLLKSRENPVFISQCGELIMMNSKSEHSLLSYSLSNNLHLVLFSTDLLQLQCFLFVCFWQSKKQEQKPDIFLQTTPGKALNCLYLRQHSGHASWKFCWDYHLSIFSLEIPQDRLSVDHCTIHTVKMWQREANSSLVFQQLLRSKIEKIKLKCL